MAFTLLPKTNTKKPRFTGPSSYFFTLYPKVFFKMECRLQTQSLQVMEYLAVVVRVVVPAAAWAGVAALAASTVGLAAEQGLGEELAAVPLLAFVNNHPFHHSGFVGYHRGYQEFAFR